MTNFTIRAGMSRDEAMTRAIVFIDLYYADA
jgi:hypothetical protein